MPATTRAVAHYLLSLLGDAAHHPVQIDLVSPGRKTLQIAIQRSQLFDERPYEMEKVELGNGADAEMLMHQAIAMVGGSSVDHTHRELLNGKNADFLLPEFNCIGELKRIHKNLDDVIKARMGAMAERWIKDGLIPRPKSHRFTLDMSRVPKVCRYEVRSMLAKFLEDNQLKKANRQIKALKERLALPNAIGVLLLVVEATESYRPEVLGELLHHLLKEKYSSIGSVIVVNHKLPGILSTTHVADPHLKQMMANHIADRELSFFIHFTVAGRPSAPPELIKKLSEAWQTVNGLSGVPKLVMSSHGSDNELAVLKGISLSSNLGLPQ